MKEIKEKRRKKGRKKEGKKRQRSGSTKENSTNFRESVNATYVAIFLQVLGKLCTVKVLDLRQLLGGRRIGTFQKILNNAFSAKNGYVKFATAVIAVVKDALLKEDGRTASTAPSATLLARNARKR
ncbi:hypothetical protein COT52_02280 [candidate division WWE3 bacterium CG08_land_8_20_14_0_20_43_13]|uniref:Uncharacterized protein n=1 Tax=candidate division WWE3 bacterium CG08_land_8_20_14_0_20_43_13 TaxID=1975087 RepID=A0A2H0X9G3_UNCKA|nr:MAG: hypothetical protein COT52_02280 [candidate division WWE3 bacterium CG08_land_8_20_14_0_20_43_13]